MNPKLEPATRRDLEGTCCACCPAPPPCPPPRPPRPPCCCPPCPPCWAGGWGCATAHAAAITKITIVRIVSSSFLVGRPRLRQREHVISLLGHQARRERDRLRRRLLARLRRPRCAERHVLTSVDFEH